MADDRIIQYHNELSIYYGPVNYMMTQSSHMYALTESTKKKKEKENTVETVSCNYL